MCRVIKFLYLFNILTKLGTHAAFYNYCVYDPTHISCKKTFEPACGNLSVAKIYDYFNTHEKTNIINIFNKFRNEIASGNFTTKKGHKFPAASNMHQLAWDMDLMFSALGFLRFCNASYSEQLVLIQFTADQFIYKSVYNNSVNWTEVIDTWTRIPAESYDKKGNMIFKEKSPKYKNLLQSISGPTNRIGCGTVVYLNQETGLKEAISSCYVGPSVGFENEKLYRAGKPCSYCYFGCELTYEPYLCIECLHPYHLVYNNTWYYCSTEERLLLRQAQEFCNRRLDRLFLPQDINELTRITIYLLNRIFIAATDEVTEDVWIGIDTGKPAPYIKLNDRSADQCIMAQGGNQHPSYMFDIGCEFPERWCCKCGKISQLKEDEFETCKLFLRHYNLGHE